MPPPEHPFPIVGVGTSAGGLTALSDLLGALPATPGLSVVVIQHLDPRVESKLTSILGGRVQMHVEDAVHGLRLEVDHVYVITPNTDVAIVDGILSVTPRQHEQRPHFAVDHFFRSLAAVQGRHAVGVVLSGTGSDGTLGLWEIRAAGGLTFAQDDSAEHVGMPESAVGAGVVDLVMSPRDIALRLLELPSQTKLFDESSTAPEHEATELFARVLKTLRHTSGVDFSQYRDTTLKRRAARRMLVRGFQSLADYVHLLEEDSAEAEALYRDVLINVTSFFRDEGLFEELKRLVFPAILEQKPDAVPIRVWVPGCSTGQEAYSVAIVLMEHLDATGSVRPIQIFATDLSDQVVLEKARAGYYPRNIEAEVSQERLRRYFTRERDGYRISKSVRDVCIFARQNLTMDPPFSRVDLVTCRNVLIYMSAVLQQRLLPIFHFALNPVGFLVLGPAEAVGDASDLFDVIDRTFKIHRKRPSTRRVSFSFMAEDWLTGGRRAVTHVPTVVDLQKEADRVALGAYGPPSVLVDEQFEIQQFRGKTFPFLEAPAGQPTTNILRMVRDGLFLELRSALTEARTTRLPVVRTGLRVTDGRRQTPFTLRILPVTTTPTGPFAMLVSFERVEADAAVTEPLQAPVPADDSTQDLARLRQELMSSKDYLQSVVDQQDIAAQELRAAHEELLSSNEELQSTNEELETAKEELQAANEELTSINEQLQRRNLDLDSLTDELSNFITSARLPMVTVDVDRRIRRVTPDAERPFNLLPTDVGRLLDQIKFSVHVDDFGAIVDRVVSTAQGWEREAQDGDGRWWLLRVQPFRTGDRHVAGATMLAVDLTAIKTSQRAIETRDFALAVIQTVLEPLVVLDSAMQIRLANQAFYDLCATCAADTLHRPLRDVCGGMWNSPALLARLHDVLKGGRPSHDLEVSCTVPSLGERSFKLSASLILDDRNVGSVLLAVEDVTDRRRVDAMRIDAEALRLVNKRKDEFLGILAHELRNPLAPMRYALNVLRNSGGSAADSTRATAVLDRQVSHMARIVDDLLDVSRITQGKVELRKAPVDVAAIIRSSVELCQPLSDEAYHEVTLAIEDEIWMEADGVRLTQVVVNLLNNAIKFTPPGGRIWLTATTASATPAAPASLEIRVKDTGIGIPSALVPKIFDMFKQGDGSIERSRGGLGVGLTLVRNLVELHGGTVTAASDGLGAGSEFIVTLPLGSHRRDIAAPSPQRTPSLETTPLRILIADDNTDGRDMLAAALRSHGHDVVAVPDGHSALEHPVADQADVCILDIGMPGLSGYGVAERLRQRRGHDVTLIALTGLGQESDKARAAEAGFDTHFTKPVDVTVLLNHLSEVKKDARTTPEDDPLATN